MPHVRKSRATVVAFACLGSIITFASVASAQANHDKAVAAFEDARKQVQFMKELGLQIEWREFQKAHTIAGDEEIGVIREFIRKCSNCGDSVS